MIELPPIQKDTPKIRKRLINILDDKESPIKVKPLKNDSDCLTMSTNVSPEMCHDLDDFCDKNVI